MTRLQGYEYRTGSAQATGRELGRIGSTSRKGDLSTLRLGQAGSWDPEESEAALGHPFICVPCVIAGEIDVLPAERRAAAMDAAIEASGDEG